MEDVCLKRYHCSVAGHVEAHVWKQVDSSRPCLLDRTMDLSSKMPSKLGDCECQEHRLLANTLVVTYLFQISATIQFFFFGMVPLQIA